MCSAKPKITDRKCFTSKDLRFRGVEDGLDVVKRYTQRFYQANEVSRFGHLLDQILRSCIAADVVPEVNTSTLRDNLSEPMPGRETLAQYAKLGGPAVSIGSDAHVADNVGAGFEQVVEMVRTVGIPHTAYFEGRTRHLLPLE